MRQASKAMRCVARLLNVSLPLPPSTCWLSALRRRHCFPLELPLAPEPTPRRPATGRCRPSGMSGRTMRATPRAARRLPQAARPRSSRSQGAPAAAAATGRAAGERRCRRCALWPVGKHAHLPAAVCMRTRAPSACLPGWTASPCRLTPRRSLRLPRQQELPELDKSDADFYRDWGITREREVRRGPAARWGSHPRSKCACVQAAPA